MTDRPQAPDLSGRRILLVANTLPPRDLSGAGEQVVQLAAGLRELGAEVRVLGRGAGGARGPKVLFPLTVVLPALRCVRSFRPEIVQVHESDGGLLALVSRVLRAFLPPTRLVALLQVTYDEEARAVRPLVDPVLGRVAVPTPDEIRFRRWRTPVQRLLGRASARCADLVLVPSRQTGHEVEADYGVPGARVLPNATGSAPDPDPSGRAIAAGTTDGPEFLFVGRLRIRKGVEVLLHALRRLLDGGVEVRLRIAGDGERAGVLRDLVRDLGLSRHVTFLGRRSKAEVREELLACAALVVPSTYEGMPLVILEAMEAGVPVVASAVSGIPEVVIDGETGWLVPAEDHRALGDALAAVLEDPDEARRRGVAGRQRLSRYRPGVVAARWARLVLGADGGQTSDTLRP